MCEVCSTARRGQLCNHIHLYSLLLTQHSYRIHRPPEPPWVKPRFLIYWKTTGKRSAPERLSIDDVRRDVRPPARDTRSDAWRMRGDNADLQVQPQSIR
jgi:hypothetical protein